MWWLIGSRAVSGAGQGMAFIGVQSFILAFASKGRQGRGAAIQVYGQNAGVIAGSALGALIVNYLDTIPQMFAIAAAVAAIIFAIAILMVPRVSTPNNQRKKDKESEIQSESDQPSGIIIALKDGEFLRTVFLIGATSKIVYNGLIFFGLPLIMSQAGYQRQDIGFALMVFAIAILISNNYTGKLTDRLGRADIVLFRGMLLSGCGAMCVGLAQVPELQNLSQGWVTTLFLYAGVILLGVANGFLAAPVVSHVLTTSTIQQAGRNAGLSIYRLIERSGHVVGPLLVGQLLLISFGGWFAFVCIGAAVLLFGIIFRLGNSVSTVRNI